MVCAGGAVAAFQCLRVVVRTLHASCFPHRFFFFFFFSKVPQGSHNRGALYDFFFYSLSWCFGGSFQESGLSTDPEKALLAPVVVAAVCGCALLCALCRPQSLLKLDMPSSLSSWGLELLFRGGLHSTRVYAREQASKQAFYKPQEPSSCSRASALPRLLFPGRDIAGTFSTQSLCPIEWLFSTALFSDWGSSLDVLF